MLIKMLVTVALTKKTPTEDVRDKGESRWVLLGADRKQPSRPFRVQLVTCTPAGHMLTTMASARRYGCGRNSKAMLVWGWCIGSPWLSGSSGSPWMSFDTEKLERPT